MVDSGAGVHTEHEDDPWTRRIPNHPARSESQLYKQSRALMLQLVGETQPWTFGPPPYQDHHGGAVWVKGKHGPRMYLLSRGMEWSAQWCADPVRVDELRDEAQELIDAFPGTLEFYQELGFDSTLARQILDEQIVDAEGVARWCDSPFNASQPLPAPAHTGTLPHGAGFHHYPKPVVDIDYFRFKDFQLWVTDPASRKRIAVAPVAPRGSGDGRVEVLYSHAGSGLYRRHRTAQQRGERLILDAEHPIALRAFRRQRRKSA